jgi:hypothetical protein
VDLIVDLLGRFGVVVPGSLEQDHHGNSFVT